MWFVTICWLIVQYEWFVQGSLLSHGSWGYLQRLYCLIYVWVSKVSKDQHASTTGFRVSYNLIILIPSKLVMLDVHVHTSERDIYHTLYTQ